jgi:hypothetical protein
VVDLGVDRGGSRDPVPQDLADLGQRRTGPQQVAGGRYLYLILKSAW